MLLWSFSNVFKLHDEYTFVFVKTFLLLMKLDLKGRYLNCKFWMLGFFLLSFFFINPELSNIVSFYKLFQNPKPAHALKLIDTGGFANYLSTLLHNLLTGGTLNTFQGNCKYKVQWNIPFFLNLEHMLLMLYTVALCDCAEQ